MQLRRLAATAAVAVATTTSLAACGKDDPTSTGDTEGVYVTTGDLAYQVQISRQLNPHDFEDSSLLTGMPASERLLPNGTEFFAVFIRVFNRTDAPHQAASKFEIVDTTGKRFDPLPLDPNAVASAYRPLVLKPGDQLPLPGTYARENTTQGGMMVFKIPVASYANRPLVLHIAPGDGQGGDATVDLDV